MNLYKRNIEFMNWHPYASDITEIPGFDDLSDPHGVLRDVSMLAASLYGSQKAFLLVNGSTAGILASIGAHAKRGGKMLADAHCHRSVTNAAYLFGLKLISLIPEIDICSGIPCSIKPVDVEKSLQQHPDIGIVVITSPSYEGVISDIKGIADVVHKAGALLIADCAHGAHLGFSDWFPKNPVSLGADIVAVSLHKTLPALTQCSLLHVCSEHADAAAVKHMLGILQTSSPSYVLTASISHCLCLLETDANRLFAGYKDNLKYFASLTGNLKSLSILGQAGNLHFNTGFFDLDPGKIVIVKKNSGKALIDVLRNKYKIELERACRDYAIAMTSICDTRDGFTRLAEALAEIDEA